MFEQRTDGRVHVSTMSYRTLSAGFAGTCSLCTSKSTGSCGEGGVPGGTRSLRVAHCAAANLTEIIPVKALII